MEFQDVLRGRRAVRDFRPDAVPPQLLRRLADAAVQAPSAMNDQPWRFTIITDTALLTRLSTLVKTHLGQSPATLPKSDHFRTVFADPDFHLFHHAPVLVVISAAGDDPWATEDCALAAGNLMLAAHDMGLGSCWVGFAQGWLNTPGGRLMLDIPGHHHVVAPIAIGWPRAPAPPVLRRAPDIVWHHDRQHAQAIAIA